MRILVCIGRSVREYANVVVEAPDAATAEAYVSEIIVEGGNRYVEMEDHGRLQWESGETCDESVVESDDTIGQDENPLVTVPHNWTPEHGQ